MTKIKNHISWPKPASTIILIREARRGFQVCLLRRRTGSGFMAGYYVFPGGVVDAEDRDPLWKKQCDLEELKWIRKPGSGMPDPDILPYGIAAIRETFEEAGILLAHLDGHGETDMASLVGMRRQDGLPPGWLKEGVVSRGWKPVLSRLYPWAHWITPVVRPKRFDTRFFATLVSRDTACLPDGRETVEGVWLEPEEALTGNLKGDTPLSPPTLVTLHELLTYPDADSLKVSLGNRMWDAPRCPRLVPASEGALLLLPGDPGYDEADGSGQVRPGEILPVGKPFSRMWCRAGIWRPVVN